MVLLTQFLHHWNGVNALLQMSLLFFPVQASVCIHMMGPDSTEAGYVRGDVDMYEGSGF